VTLVLSAQSVDPSVVCFIFLVPSSEQTNQTIAQT
jgi:hypothetical protein